MTIDEAFTHFPSLTTSRLALRHIRPDDAEAFFAAYSDDEVMHYHGHEPHHSLEESAAAIQQIEAGYEARAAIRWGITLKGDDALIGSSGLHHFGPGFQRAEIGYELQRAYWGEGIMA